MVVTLTQGLIEEVPLAEGDRVILESLPPKRILISKEEKNVPNTRRVELELDVLNAQRESFGSQISHAVARHNNHSEIDDDDLEVMIKYWKSERDKVDVAIAEKKLQLFDLQGA